MLLQLDIYRNVVRKTARKRAHARFLSAFPTMCEQCPYNSNVQWLLHDIKRTCHGPYNIFSN